MPMTAGDKARIGDERVRFKTCELDVGVVGVEDMVQEIPTAVTVEVRAVQRVDVGVSHASSS